MPYPAPVHLRPAVGADLPGITVVDELSFVHAGERFSQTRLRNLLTNPRATVTVAVGGGAMVCGISPSPRTPGKGRGGGVRSSFSIKISHTASEASPLPALPRSTRGGENVTCDCLTVGGERVLGWAAGLVWTRGRPWGRIYALAVHPDARGNRLGPRLLHDMIDALRRRGSGRIFLEVRPDNAPAVRLYESTGFVTCRLLHDYYGPGIPAQRMALEPPVTWHGNQRS